MDTKQVIVMRKDLKMRRGKEIAQGSHASISFLTSRIRDNKIMELSEIELKWIDSGFTKVTLQVHSETELLTIYNQALDNNLECHLIKDSGKTEFNGIPTFTCLCIGPDESEKIDKVTKHLQLY